MRFPPLLAALVALAVRPTAANGHAPSNARPQQPDLPPLPEAGFFYTPSIWEMGKHPINHAPRPLKTHRHCRTLKRTKRK